MRIPETPAPRALCDVKFHTVQSTIKRPDYVHGGFFQANVPFARITSIEHADGEIAVSDLGLPHDPQGEQKEYNIQLDKELLDRLLGYVATRLNVQDPPWGNCHDFSWFMVGEPMGDFEEATLAMNELLRRARPRGREVALGTIAIVGYPGYSRMMYPAGQQPLPGTSEMGPLQVSHSCITVDDKMGGNTPYALHRVALNGPLGDDTLQEYRNTVPAIELECWEDGRVPDATDIDLYYIDRRAKSTLGSDQSL